MKEKKKRAKKKARKVDLKKKATEARQRDKKGRLLPGHKPMGGRPKGEPIDVLCKDGKLRSPEQLIKDILATYQTLGGKAFLKKWAMHSHVNLRKFVEILFRFAPQVEGFVGETNIQIISNIPRSNDTDERKTIRELKLRLGDQEKELKRLREAIHTQGEEVIDHEPISLDLLPEKSEDVKRKRDEKFRESREIEQEEREAPADDQPVKEAEEEISKVEEPESSEESLEEVRKRLEKLSEGEMLKLYKELEKERATRVDPENYKPEVIVRNYLLILKRKREEEARSKPGSEQLIPLTEREERLVWGKGKEGISED